MSSIHTIGDDSFYCCRQIETLGLHDDFRARKILTEVANRVQPIMAKKKWTVLKLIEFTPKDKKLLGLNVNQGEEIRVRLREAVDNQVFMPIESIIGTVLHELVHNVYKSHNKDFYSLLNVVVEEFESLRHHGGSSTWFTYSCNRLGGKRAVTSNSQDKRTILAEAAEKRRKRASLFSVPQKLGGPTMEEHQHISPKWMAVVAALRRRNDEECCGNSNSKIQDIFQPQVTATLVKSSNTSAKNIVIDLTNED
eukprot:jgi/Galph1/4953/GphlegSOOS_G3603.1